MFMQFIQQLPGSLPVLLLRYAAIKGGGATQRSHDHSDLGHPDLQSNDSSLADAALMLVSNKF